MARSKLQGWTDMAIQTRQIKDRAEWLDWRTQFVNASEIAILAGYNKEISPLRLWAQKTGELEATEQTAMMKRGILLEDAVIQMVREERPDLDIFKPEVYFSDPHSRMGCTPDAVGVTDDGDHIIIQCKVIAKPIFENKFPVDDNGNRVAPMDYTLQTLAEMMVTGYDRGILAVMVLDAFSNDLHLFDIDRHPTAEAKIREIVTSYWDAVDNGREPKADYTKDARLLSVLFPPDVKQPPLDLS